jgi:hypothetical protein
VEKVHAVHQESSDVGTVKPDCTGQNQLTKGPTRRSAAWAHYNVATSESRRRPQGDPQVRPDVRWTKMP